MNKEKTVGFNRLLVVDDAAANRQLLMNLLTSHGYRVHPASDGELALEFVQTTLPDLILLDIRMPGMDGYEVCRRLKADERTRSIPIIFISILENERDKVKGFQAGGVDYITKPFQPEEILARVRTHLSLRELAGNLEQEVVARTEELTIANQRLQQEIAERKQVEEALRLNAQRTETLLRLNQMTDATLDEITNFAFEAAVEQTRSKLGFLGFMNDDETVMTVQVWSRNVMPGCDVANKTLNFPVESSGLWGEAVRQRRPVVTNDYSAPNLWKKGTPDGHMRLSRHLSLPVIVGGKIVLVAGVGNKDGDYDEADVNQLTLLMEGTWRLIERRRAEKDRKLSQYMIDRSALGIFRGSEDGRILFVNDYWARKLGYTPEELCTLSFFDIDPDLTPEFWRAHRAKLAATDSHTFESAHRRKNGGEIPVEVTVNLLKYGDQVYSCSFARDITDRKRAEEALEKRIVALTRPLDDAANIDFEELFSLSDIQRLQDEFARATGVASLITLPDGTPLTEPGGFCRLCEIVRATEKGFVRCTKSDAALGQISHSGPTVRQCLSAGLWGAGAAISVGGRHVANWLIGQVRDESITEEQVRAYAREVDADEEAAVEAFREVPVMSDERFGQVAQALYTLARQLSSIAYQNVQQARFIAERKRNELVMVARMRLLQFAATHSLEELLEATLNEVEELTESQIGFYHFFEDDQQTLSLQSWSTRTKREFCKAEGKGLHYPVSEAGVWVDCIHQRRPVIHDDYAALPHRKGLPSGHAPVVRELVVPVFRGEKIVAILGVGNKPRAYTQQDVETVSLLADLAWSIVENKRTDQALRESERKYRSIVEYAPFGITRSTREGKLVSVNPALASILKYDSAQELMETINRSSIQEVLFPIPSEREPLVENILEHDSWTIFNNRLRCKDGSFVICQVHSRRIVDKNGQASEFESFQENITDRLEAEQALRESEEKFRVLAETSPVAIGIFQGEKLIYANPATERLFGYSVDELLRMRFWEWATENCKEIIQRCGLARLNGEPMPGQYEATFITKTGDEKCVLISAGVMEHRDRPTGVVSYLDITERKRTEELIRASLEEKEVLLREIHHRVKNNLQVVSSLLFLQSQKFTDKELQSCFLESQSRICSMALAHEQLYQSKNLAEVSVKAYVENLIGQLEQIFRSPGQEVDCRLAVQDIELDIEKVIPCGLLLTELLSNVYKHAFVDGRAGHINISMKDRSGEVELSVADDGVGLPADFDYRQAQTLGLQLVTVLVNQLNGSLELDRSNGTRFLIRFSG